MLLHCLEEIWAGLRSGWSAMGIWLSVVVMVAVAVLDSAWILVFTRRENDQGVISRFDRQILVIPSTPL